MRWFDKKTIELINYAIKLKNKKKAKTRRIKLKISLVEHKTVADINL